MVLKVVPKVTPRLLKHFFFGETLLTRRVGRDGRQIDAHDNCMINGKLLGVYMFRILYTYDYH